MMSTPRQGTKRRVWVGLGAACAAVIGWSLWTQRQAVAPAASAAGQGAFVQLAGAGTAAADRLLQERADLLDPTPLFFPTERNYGYQPLRTSTLRQPGQFFENFPSKAIMDEQSLPSYGSQPARVPEKLADVLVQGNEAPFAGMGQAERPMATLPVRGGYIEVRALNDSQPIIGHPLDGLSLSRKDFAPVEFLVVVEASGMISEPLLTAGSGWDDIDNYFRTYLVKSYRLGEKLRPGRYRVVLGT